MSSRRPDPGPLSPPRSRLGRRSWDQLHVYEKDLTKSLLNEAFQASPGKGELSRNLHHPSALRGIASLQKLQFIRITRFISHEGLLNRAVLLKINQIVLHVKISQLSGVKTGPK